MVPDTGPLLSYHLTSFLLSVLTPTKLTDQYRRGIPGRLRGRGFNPRIVIMGNRMPCTGITQKITLYFFARSLTV